MSHLIIRKACLIDGTGREPLQNATVVVEGARITDILTEQVEVPEDACVVDAEGKTIMPGMIDAHIHIMFDPDITHYKIVEPTALSVLKASRYLQEYLSAGFTTIRDAGARHPAELSLKKAVDLRIIDGPRMLTTGYICMTGGRDDFYMEMGEFKEVSGPHEARAAAREYLKAGVDWIKCGASGSVMIAGPPGAPQMTVDEMKAAFEEAHKVGKKAWAHACGAQSVINAIEAGVDTVTHGYYLDDDAVQMMVRNDICYVPTLTVVHRLAEHGVKGGIPEDWARKAEETVESQLESFKRALKAGVRIAMGTDAGCPYDNHGENAFELELMVEAGMQEMEAILSCTGRSAQELGIGDDVGTIEPGKLADIIVVNGNPLHDIGVLQDKRKIEVVLKNGEIVSRSGKLVRNLCE